MKKQNIRRCGQKLIKTVYSERTLRPPMGGSGGYSWAFSGDRHWSMASRLAVNSTYISIAEQPVLTCKTMSFLKCILSNYNLADF